MLDVGGANPSPAICNCVRGVREPGPVCGER